MNNQTIENPVTGERVTFIETSSESGGARTVADLEVTGGGGVPTHMHGAHDERIDVVEGEIEVTMDGVARRVSAGQHLIIQRGTVHAWRNPARDRTLRFRGTITPGHPGFESVLRVLFGLGRDGELRKNGLPRRFGDLALVADLDPSIFVGFLRLLQPIMRWSARRERARGRATELLRRYGCADAI